jgi:hypothetical protein
MNREVAIRVENLGKKYRIRRSFLIPLEFVARRGIL